MLKIVKKFYNNYDNENREINKQVLIMFISVILTVLCTIGVTLSAFVWSDTSKKEQNIVVGDLSMTITPSSDPLGSNLEVPIPDSDVDSLDPYTFTIKNNGKVDALYKLKLVDDTAAMVADECTSIQLNKSYIGLKLTGAKNFTRLLSVGEDIDIGLLKPSQEKTYSIYLWIKENAPNEAIGKHFHGKILLESEQTIDRDIEVASAVLEDNEIKTDYEFTVPTDDNGLFRLKENEKVYFFKGPVTNNYLEFGKHKSDLIYNDNILAKAGDPILWRIVRINSDNSITLIMQHQTGNYVVYNSKGLSEYKDSEMETHLNNWYKDNFENTIYDSHVKSSTFCNDTSSTLSERFDTDTPAPTLECSDEYKIDSKVGLITADEAVYAGARWFLRGSGLGTYIYTGNKFYTMTGSNKAINNWGHLYYYDGVGVYTGMVGLAGERTVGELAAARPVITITSDVKVNNGDGTINNPYRILEDELEIN